MENPALILLVAFIVHIASIINMFRASGGATERPRTLERVVWCGDISVPWHVAAKCLTVIYMFAATTYTMRIGMWGAEPLLAIISVSAPAIIVFMFFQSQIHFGYSEDKLFFANSGEPIVSRTVVVDPTRAALMFGFIIFSGGFFYIGNKSKDLPKDFDQFWRKSIFGKGGIFSTKTVVACSFVVISFVWLLIAAVPFFRYSGA